MPYLQYFFNPAHLFSLRPEAMSNKAVTILVVVFAGLIILGILSKLKTKKIKSALEAKVWSQFFSLSLTIGLCGLVYAFLASQGVILLAARFWLVLIMIVAVIWAGFIAKYMIVELPKKKLDIKKQQEFKKYIP